MRTKEQILLEMIDAMPFKMSGNIRNYVTEAMQIYANEYHQSKVKDNALLHDVSKCDYCECKEDEYVLICKECRQGIEESHFC